jgi:hypothetical protein
MILSKRKFHWLFLACGVILFLASFLIANSIHPQPAEIDVTSSPASEIKQALTQMYVLEDTILCVPGTNIDILATILVDTGDYQPTLQELKTIVQIFGLDGLTHAGLLTAKQAYYQLRLNPPQVSPPPGVNPTQPPVMRCSGPPFKIALAFESIALETTDKAIVEYANENGDYEAVLRKINGQWMVAGVKLIHWYQP